MNTGRAPDNGQPYEHVMTQAAATGAADRLAVSVTTATRTPISTRFAHRFFDGKMWNGYSWEEVTEGRRRQEEPIYTLHNGIFTRGILMDIARLKGVPYLEPDAHLRRGPGGVGEAGRRQGVGRRRGVHPDRPLDAQGEARALECRREPPGSTRR